MSTDPKPIVDSSNNVTDEVDSGKNESIETEPMVGFRMGHFIAVEACHLDHQAFPHPCACGMHLLVGERSM